MLNRSYLKVKCHLRNSPFDFLKIFLLHLDMFSFFTHCNTVFTSIFVFTHCIWFCFLLLAFTSIIVDKVLSLSAMLIMSALLVVPCILEFYFFASYPFFMQEMEYIKLKMYHQLSHGLVLLLQEKVLILLHREQEMA
jgi:hypothetical protein